MTPSCSVHALIANSRGAAIAYRTFQFYPDLVSHLFTVCVPYIPPAKSYLSIEDFVKALPNFKYQLQFGSGELEEHYSTPEGLRQFINAMYGGLTPEGKPGFAGANGIDHTIVPTLEKNPILTEEVNIVP
jgi:soluble epoxide hydrolase/lipid-phosphate phosphatase